ncbi:MAG TPA: DUF3300 domain-containing protein [Rhodopila sp.]|nr:DUF3300 domain-containing protein [Rhodopila sp.]
MSEQLALPPRADGSASIDFRRPHGCLGAITKRSLAVALSTCLVLTSISAWAAPTSYSPPAVVSPAAPQQNPAQLQQLVAPIALYPDPLVAQILAAATYPAQIVEADRWLQQHTQLAGQELADQVDTQPWDPSVKALTAFPSVLANMDRNLSWTSALGDAYVNQPQAVMNAVQDMRRRAQQAGNLKHTPQENVTTQGDTIQIQPTSPDVVYVPEYDPWLVYGPPLTAWPGWYPSPGLYVATPGVVFGLGIGIGVFAGLAWGWHHWGFDWAHRTVMFNHRTYISRRTSFINRRTVINRHTFATHRSLAHRSVPFHHSAVTHGLQSGTVGRFHSGGFARSHAFQGRSRFAGGFHAGGFHGGGRR